MRLSAIVLAAALLTASCDHFGGIDAYSPLTALPEAGCVPRALASVDGVSGVHHRQTEWRTAPSKIARGASHLTVAETWSYRVGSLEPRILIYDAGNAFSFNNGIGLTAGAMSDEEIAAYRPLIERINDHVARACGLDLSGISIMEIPQRR